MNRMRINTFHVIVVVLWFSTVKPDNNFLCVEDQCARKCCPSDQLLNRITNDCELKNRSRPLLNGKVNQVLRDRITCPYGQQMARIQPQRIRAKNSDIFCMEGVVTNDTSKGLQRVAIICYENTNSTLGLNQSRAVENGRRLKQVAQHITLRKCCDTPQRYSFTKNRCCEQVGERFLNHSLRDVIQSKYPIQNVDFIEKFTECETNFIAKNTMDFYIDEAGNMTTKELPGHSFQPNEYCLEEMTATEMEYYKTNVTVRFCLPDPCPTKTCLRKCCPNGYACHEANGICFPFNKTVSMEFRNENHEKMIVGTNDDLIYSGGFLQCSLGGHLLNETEFYPLPSGNIYAPHYLPEDRLIEKYCLDVFLDANLSHSFKAYICFSGKYETSEDDRVILVIFSYLLIVSSVFLIATFIVYAMLAELRNVHGLNIMSYLVALSTTFILLAIVKMYNKMDSEVCKALGIALNFFFLASFAWSSIISFDIWWTLSCKGQKQIATPRYLRQKKTKKFGKYSLCAWGLPLIIVSVGQIIQHVPNLPDDILKPDFGIHKCFFHNNKARWFYFHGPLSVFLAVDVLFFILTAKLIRKVGKMSSMATRGQQGRQR